MVLYSSVITFSFCSWEEFIFVRVVSYFFQCVSTSFQINCFGMIISFHWSTYSPADTGRKLNVHKTLRRRPVQFTSCVYGTGRRTPSIVKYHDDWLLCGDT